MKVLTPLDLQGLQATNAANPTSPQALATKSYVDTATATLTAPPLDKLCAVAQFGGM